MDLAWLEVIDRMRIEEAIRLRRISSRLDALVTKSLRSRKHLDIETECPSLVKNPTAIASVIAQCSHNLQSLDLKIRPENSKYETLPSHVEIRRRVMMAINENARKLKKLHINRCCLSAGAIGSFGDLPESIEEISITNSLIDCTEWDVATIIRKAFEVLFQKCRRLRVFEISGRSLNSSHFHVDPTILRFMSDTVEHLVIAVGNSLRINNLSFLKGKKLKTLILQRSFISSSDLEHVLAMSDTVTHLDLSYSPNLADCEDIAKLKNLKRLALTNNRDSVHDKSLSVIIQECSHLEELCLDQCSFLTSLSLLSLGSLQNLRKLTLSGVGNVDDSVCEQIARCTRLTFLDINFCRKVDRRGLKAILTCLTALEHLEVLGIRAYSHRLIAKRSASSLKTVVCDTPLETFSFTLPPIPPSLVTA